MSTVIMPCGCYSPFQDKEYGPGLRVFNVQLKDRARLMKARCTVCGTSRETKGVLRNEVPD